MYFSKPYRTIAESHLSKALALPPTPMSEPLAQLAQFPDRVRERFSEWMQQQQQAGRSFSVEQQRWLEDGRVDRELQGVPIAQVGDAMEIGRHIGHPEHAW